MKVQNTVIERKTTTDRISEGLHRVADAIKDSGDQPVRTIILSPSAQGWEDIETCLNGSQAVKTIKFDGVSRDPDDAVNPCKVPQGIDINVWGKFIVDMFACNYGLLEKGISILDKALYELYNKAGALKDASLSDAVSLKETYALLMEYQKNDGPSAESYGRIAQRLAEFSGSDSFGTAVQFGDKGKSINEIFSGDEDITLIDAHSWGNKYMNDAKNFVYGVLTLGFFKCVVSGIISCDKPTILVLDAANAYIFDKELFQGLYDRAAGYNISIVTLTDDIDLLPKFVIANSINIIKG